MNPPDNLNTAVTNSNSTPTLPNAGLNSTLSTSLSEANSFLAQVQAIQTDLERQVTELQRRVIALQLGFDRLLDPEDYAEVMSGEQDYGAPPEIIPGEVT